MLKKLILSVLDGAVGTAFVENFDKDGDGRVSWKEVLTADPYRFVKFAVSASTSYFTAMYFM